MCGVALAIPCVVFDIFGGVVFNFFCGADSDTSCGSDVGTCCGVDVFGGGVDVGTCFVFFNFFCGTDCDTCCGSDVPLLCCTDLVSSFYVALKNIRGVEFDVPGDADSDTSCGGNVLISCGRSVVPVSCLCFVSFVCDFDLESSCGDNLLTRCDVFNIIGGVNFSISCCVFPEIFFCVVFEIFGGVDPEIFCLMMLRWVAAAFCALSSLSLAISLGFFFFSFLPTSLSSFLSSFISAWRWFRSAPSPSLPLTRSFPNSSPLATTDFPTSFISFSRFLSLLLRVCCVCALSWPSSSLFVWIFVPAVDGIISAPKNQTPFSPSLAAAPLWSPGAVFFSTVFLSTLFEAPSLFALPAGGGSSSCATFLYFSTPRLGFPSWTEEPSVRWNSTLAFFLRPSNSCGSLSFSSLPGSFARLWLLFPVYFPFCLFSAFVATFVASKKLLVLLPSSLLRSSSTFVSDWFGRWASSSYWPSSFSSATSSEVSAAVTPLRNCCWSRPVLLYLASSVLTSVTDVFSFKIDSISIAAIIGVCCSLSHCNFLCFRSSLIVEDSGDNSCLFLDLGVTCT